MKIPEIKKTFLNISYSDHLRYLVESYEENNKVVQGRWSTYSFSQPLGITDFSISRNQVGVITFEIGRYKDEDYHHTFMINPDNLFYENYKNLMGEKESFIISKDLENPVKGLQVKKEGKSFAIQFIGFEENEPHELSLSPFYQTTDKDKKLREILDDFLKGLDNTVEYYHAVLKPKERIRRIPTF